MSALVPIILQALPSVINGAQHLWAFIAAERAVGQQTSEWTPEMEKQFVDGLLARATQSKYQQDPK